MKAALYARVSTENQDLENQVEKLKRFADKEQEIEEFDLYQEKVSSIKERPQFEEILENLEEYDLVVVTKLDRFARSTKDLLQRLEQLEENDVDLRATDQPIKTDDELYGDIMLKLLGVFAEWERKMIRRRLKEGYDKAREEGRVGRPEKLEDPEERKELVALYNSGHYTWEGLMEKYDISRAKLSEILNEEGAMDD